MRAGFCTPVPSSVKRRTPSAAISAIGRQFLAGASLGNRARDGDVQRAWLPRAPERRRPGPACRVPARCWASRRARRIPREHRRARPDSMVSASSRPGSRRCVCRSTKLGPTQQPSASITVAPAGTSSDAPTSTMRPSSISTSPTSLVLSPTTSPPRISILTVSPRSRRRRSSTTRPCEPGRRW